MLLEKYARGREGLDVFHLKLGCSHAWRGIVRSSNILEGTRWGLSNGRYAKFWEDVWVRDEPLRKLAQKPVFGKMLRRSVREYLQYGRWWNWLAFSSFLPTSMAAIIVSEAEGTEEKLMWYKGWSGIFSVSKYYSSISGNGTQERRPGWSKILKLKVQQRVRMFLGGFRPW